MSKQVYVCVKCGTEYMPITKLRKILDERGKFHCINCKKEISYSGNIRMIYPVVLTTPTEQKKNKTILERELKKIGSFLQCDGCESYVSEAGRGVSPTHSGYLCTECYAKRWKKPSWREKEEAYRMGHSRTKSAPKKPPKPRK